MQKMRIEKPKSEFAHFCGSVFFRVNICLLESNSKTKITEPIFIFLN